jgi:hypothetical protein
VDDLELAQAQASLAARVQDQGPGLIAGHWGFQHHLERAGWTALEDDAPLPEGVLLARSHIAWPQSPGGCVAQVDTLQISNRWPGPRVHTLSGGANFHGHSLAADPPLPVLAPWSLGDDPLDQLSLYRVCSD